ncbi:S-layer homology domain-containing protein [Sporomusa sp. KB1]|jgi:hypothetical protein|uniref:S-layer homology domain-containing protein n=1 Tax=Sporomusa sp. KB1 TaxID=943346 RepID=UPI00119DD682|nr:S-layer homology domain-containing protein [Sporomusa sp. KB1]TWH45311.1 capsule assembly protein Wzi [Sporomusa sp. KB1]
MKRQTAMALAAVFAMSVAGTALAAPANPFVDVPAKHWAYDSINKLAQAGVISGYGDGTYQGDKTLTRYEVATIVAKAMANSDKADAASQKEIDALKAEFGAELNNLGVRVDNLEKNSSKVKFTGEVRVRYDNQDETDFGFLDRTREWTRFRLNMEAPIDKNVTFHGRYETETNWGSGSDSESKLTHAYIDGKIGEVGYSFGRQPVWLGQGLIADIDSNNDGLFLSGGNKVKVAVGAFKREDSTYYGGTYDMNFVAANIDAQLNKNLNMTASYLADKDDDLYKTTSVGLKYTGIKNFTVTGEYGENDSDFANVFNGDKAKAWMGQLKYRGAQSDKVGSMGVWVGYRSAESGFDPGQLTTLESGRIDDDFTYGILDNVKGAEFGVEYTLFKNGVLTVQYNDLDLKDNPFGLPGFNKNKKSFFTHLTYTF